MTIPLPTYLDRPHYLLPLPIHASDDDAFPEFTDSDDFDDLFPPTNDDHNINNFSTSIIDNHDTTPPPTQSTTDQRDRITFHSSFTRQLNISTFVTQNTHGLRRLPRDSDGKLLTTAPYDYTR